MARFPNLRIISNLRRAMFHNLTWDRVDAATCSNVQNHRVNAGSLFRQSPEWMTVQRPNEATAATFRWKLAKHGSQSVLRSGPAGVRQRFRFVISCRHFLLGENSLAPPMPTF